MVPGSVMPPSALKLRILSGLVLAPITIALIFMGSWYFMILITLGASISLYEWCNMVRNTKSHIPNLLAGCLYIAVCFSSYVFLRFGFIQGAWLALSVMVSVWASDIGAYFVGRAIGGARLAPKISPKKTWAGLGGAVFFSGLSFVFLALISKHLKSYLVTDMNLSVHHILPLFFIGGFLGVVGQIGDLLISAFKRRAGIKDTGDLIPGHGGLLDRIDSLMLVSPVFLIMVILWLK